MERCAVDIKGGGTIWRWPILPVKRMVTVQPVLRERRLKSRRRMRKGVKDIEWRRQQERHPESRDVLVGRWMASLGHSIVPSSHG